MPFLEDEHYLLPFVKLAEKYKTTTNHIEAIGVTVERTQKFKDKITDIEKEAVGLKNYEDLIRLRAYAKATLYSKLYSEIENVLKEQHLPDSIYNMDAKPTP